MVTFLYSAIVLATAAIGVFQGDFWPSLAGALAPMLALIAGSGIREGIDMPDHSPRGVVIFGGIFLAVAAYWIHSAGWNLRIAAIEVPGVAICLLGFVIGLLFHRPGMSVGRGQIPRSSR